MSSRKTKTLDPKLASRERRNIGPVISFAQQHAEDAAVFPDRLLRRLFQNTIDFLASDQSELERFFSHFFDNSITVEERDQFVDRFLSNPPRAQLGYARTSTEFPYWGIVLQEETEEDSFIGDYEGLDTDDRVEFHGALFNSVYTTYIYAHHPDVCSYQFQLAKAIVIGGKKWLLGQGLVEIQLSGGELNPEDGYFPEAVYVRALRVRCKSNTSVPRVLLAQNTKLGSIHADDIVVEGLRGGVHALDPE